MPKSPLKLYQSRVDDGALEADHHQLVAVQSLQSLYDGLMDAQQSGGFLAGFKRSKADDLKGVYLHGGVGRGKSMVMDLFFSCLPKDMKKRRVHFHVFMIEVHNFLHSLRQSGGNKGVDDALPKLAASIAKDVQILCFDEFHVTDVADAMILARLFAALFDHGVVVVATSNWEPDRLYEGGLQRELFLPFIDLLKERMEVLPLDGPKDYRAQALEEDGSYFHPLNKKMAAKVDEVFVHLTGGAEPYVEEIEVKGRLIEAKVVAAGAARFSFSQLCEEAYGAEDYLAIARRYPVVFLDGVPALGEERRNEAKRLMTLIDALYESGTKLVVAAETPPEKIYQGDDHGFEFKRTVSRLLEMQGADYLEKR